MQTDPTEQILQMYRWCLNLFAVVADGPDRTAFTSTRTRVTASRETWRQRRYSTCSSGAACPAPQVSHIFFFVIIKLILKATSVLVLRIRIRDPRWVKNRIRIQDEQPGSYLRELRNQFFGFKYLNYLMQIRDRKNSDPGLKTFGSGINIPDPQHCSVSISRLLLRILFLKYRSGLHVNTGYGSIAHQSGPDKRNKWWNIGAGDMVHGVKAHSKNCL